MTHLQEENDTITNRPYDNTYTIDDNDIEEDDLLCEVSFKRTKQHIERLMTNNYALFIKSLLSIEMGIDNEQILDNVYNHYMTNDSLTLIHEGIYHHAEQLQLPYMRHDYDRTM